MTPILYPHAYEDHDDVRDAIRSMAGIPFTASYRDLDAYEMAAVRAAPADHRPYSRETLEKHLRWQYWHLAGRNTFVIGPETTARIVSRVKDGDVPTDPVAPAYFEFEQPPVNYAASRRLRAAFVYRGVVGRITFMPDPPTTREQWEDMSLTVYLPSVFRNRDLEHLKKGMTATRGVGHASKASTELARAMAQGVGGRFGEQELAASAARLESLGRAMRGEEGEPEMDIAATLFSRVYGEPVHRPNPLLPKAARMVMVAADEARKADPAYARPRYLNTSQIDRNWMEPGDQVVERRDDVVRLP